MRLATTALAAMFVLSAAAGASARECRSGNRIGSSFGSAGINAVAPSRAIQNPCSRMYAFGAHRHRVHRSRSGRTYR